MASTATTATSFQKATEDKMGACDFRTPARGKDAKEAFRAAREQAQYDHGHAGYTGTIAEKNNFVMIPTPGLDKAAARALAEELLSADDWRIRDKWGPAGCVALGDGEFLFFGFASC